MEGCKPRIQKRPYRACARPSRDHTAPGNGYRPGLLIPTHPPTPTIVASHTIMEVHVRAPDRPSVQNMAARRSALPPRPDSPRLGGTHGSLSALRSARLAQTRVWGAAAAVQRDEVAAATMADTTRRPVSVFGSMRNSATSTSSYRLSVISSRSEYRTAVFRRAASSHRYARISGNSARGASGSARVAPKIVLREQLAAIDEGLGAIAVVETPVLYAPHSHHHHVHGHRRASNSSLHSLHDAPIEA